MAVISLIHVKSTDIKRDTYIYVVYRCVMCVWKEDLDETPHESLV